MLGKIEGRRRRGRQRMRWLDGITNSMDMGFGWTPGVGDGLLRGLACCGSWGRKESDTTGQLNWTVLLCLLLWKHKSFLCGELLFIPILKWDIERADFSSKYLRHQHRAGVGMWKSMKDQGRGCKERSTREMGFNNGHGKNKSSTHKSAVFIV